jgi:hypothetical protein
MAGVPSAARRLEQPAAGPSTREFTRSVAKPAADRPMATVYGVDRGFRRPTNAGFLRAANFHQPYPPLERPDSRELAFLRRNAQYLIGKMNAVSELFQHAGMPFATARRERGNISVDHQGTWTISVNERPVLKFFNDYYDNTNTHIMMAGPDNLMYAGRNLPSNYVLEANDLVNSALKDLLGRQLL